MVLQPGKQQCPFQWASSLSHSRCPGLLQIAIMQQDSSPSSHFPNSSSFPTASAHPRVGCPSPSVCMDHRQTQMSFFPNINYQCWFWFLNLGKVPGLLKDIGDVNIPSGSSCHGVLGSNSLLPSLCQGLEFTKQPKRILDYIWPLHFSLWINKLASSKLKGGNWR